MDVSPTPHNCSICSSVSADAVQAGEDGLVYAAVQYPSLKELWPDVYFTEAVKTVQVREDLILGSRLRLGFELRMFG